MLLHTNPAAPTLLSTPASQIPTAMMALTGPLRCVGAQVEGTIQGRAKDAEARKERLKRFEPHNSTSEEDGAEE